MVNHCHSKDSLDSIRASFQINHLLLTLWSKRFLGGFEIPKSTLCVACEVLGTPVSDDVFLEPHSASPEGKSWFWMKKVSHSDGDHERFLLSRQENPFCKTIYVLQYERKHYERSVFDYRCCQARRSVERALSDRFQGLLLSYLEVDCS